VPFRNTLLLLLPGILIFASCGIETADMNVIMIGLDTTRADHLSSYGSTKCQTPNLDELARDGIRFDQCVTVAPSTLPSFTSVMSGMYPHTHRVPYNGFRASDNLLLLSELFKEAGYDTAAFIGSYALHSDLNLDQGFDLYEETFDRDVAGRQLQRRADRLNESLFPWLETHKGSKFLLFIQYFDPHLPYDPPLPYGHDPAVSGKPRWDYANLLRLGHAINVNPDARIINLGKHASRMYAGEIAFLDHQIGRLVEKLDELGLRKKSIIIIWGDHGETLMEHKTELFNHGRNVYQTTIHVPLIFHAPSALPSGKVVKDLVTTIDIAPTICDLTGLSAVEMHEGQSLMSLIKPEKEAPGWQPSAAFVEAQKPVGEMGEANSRWLNQQKDKCIILGEWKLVLSPLEKQPWKLFNLRADPDESHDVYSEQLERNPTLVKNLTDRIHAWMNDLPDADGTDIVGPDAEAKEKLRALGYFQ